MKIRLLSLSALLILASGSSCLDSQTVLSGQIGQITDAVVFDCKPYSQTEGTHQCLMLANPYQGAVKIFDMTDNQFVLSPVAYFPLVIQVGEAPTQLATFGNRLFALDPIKLEIYEIPSDLKAPNQTPIKAAGSKPNNFAIIADAQGAMDIKVAQTGDGVYQAAGTQLLVTQDNILTIGSKQVTLTAPVSQMVNDGKKALLGLTDKTLVVVDIASASIEATTTLKEIAGAVYLPSSVPGTPATCCNGETNWVGALLMNGTLQYWPYNNQSFNKAPQSIDIVSTTGVASFALTNPTKLLGVKVDNKQQDGLSCERRLFLIYSGAIFNTCEGNSNIKRVDQMEY